MVAQFPQQPTNIDAWLIPKLEVFLIIRDVSTSEAGPRLPGQTDFTSISRTSRIIELDIVAGGIQVSLIKNAISRLFTYIKNAVDNDINITPANLEDLPLKPYSLPTNTPQIRINIDVNRTKAEKTVQLELKIVNLKKDSLQNTFDRLLMYIDSVVINDLNPSI